MTGADVTLDDLEADPHSVLAGMAAAAPVTWVPALGGWVVTQRDLVIAMMRDPVTFTVDDPRFATARVVGPSMLSVDGDEHTRHRRPFGDAFRLPEIRRRLAGYVEGEAHRLTRVMLAETAPEIRRHLAGPLAVEGVVAALGLIGTRTEEVLGWYDQIVAAVTAASTTQGTDSIPSPGFDRLADRVGATIAAGGSLLADAGRMLSVGEVVSNAAVIMFGGIETVEGTIANTFAHLLADRRQWEEVVAEPALIPNAVEESMRLEPAVLRVDRYATSTVEVGGANIRRGHLVILSIASANRDPATYPEPDTFDVRRREAKTHLTFAHGPHACLGLHLARLEAQAAVAAAVDLAAGMRLIEPAIPTGSVFRKPDRVAVSVV